MFALDTAPIFDIQNTWGLETEFRDLEMSMGLGSGLNYADSLWPENNTYLGLEEQMNRPHLKSSVLFFADGSADVRATAILATVSLSICCVIS